jgi:glycosyltransferase involved in cell wall biosynthesis
VHRIVVDVDRRRSKLVAAWGLGAVFLRLCRRVDVVHLHGFSRKSMLLIALARLTGKKILLKVTSPGEDDPQGIQRLGRLAFRCYRSADRYVGVSPRLRELHAASGLPPQRFVLIPNGVDPDRFRRVEPERRPALRHELGLVPDQPLVLFVGFFSHDKDPRTLYEAWRRVQEAGPPTATLLFIGATRSRYYEVDDALATSIRDDARARGLADRLRFIEAALAIDAYYRAADVFVLPSRREGLPNALLEAMASGLPSVATRLPGVTDVLIDHGVDGLLFAPGDVGALAHELRGLLADTERANEIGRRARQRVEREYPITQTAAAHLAAYAALLAPCRRHGASG